MFRPLRASQRLYRAIFVLVRVVLCVASLQISALAHAGLDLAVVVLSQHAPDADEDCDEHDCPPGCPSCHHAHASSTALPGQAPSVLATFSSLRPFEGPPTDLPPPDPTRSPPDRPPRA
jgi:hypothetical protein